MQQNQIICGVLTGYCCCIRLPLWIPHLNVFCASTHDVIVRHHAIWCNEETSSGYSRLWFWRRAAAWRVLVYTGHVARIAAALSFMSTLVNRYCLFSSLISTECASATSFMSSTDASANTVLPSLDVEKVTSQGLIPSSHNRSCFLFACCAPCGVYSVNRGCPRTSL